MTDVLNVQRDGHVEIWTINLPESRNPISGDDVIDAFVGRVDHVNADLDVRAVVLTGAGSAFSAGGDVKAMRDKSGLFGGPPHSQRTGYLTGIQRIPLAMQRCEVPIVAAVNGPAVGAGCDLALMCDIRIASSKAFFAESFVTLGLIPGDGGAWFLPRVVGYPRAAEMILTGDRIDATKAEAWGLVSQVVPEHSLLDEAMRVARRIAAHPPLTVRMSKRLLREAHQGRLETTLELSAALQAISQHTDDHSEAIAAFFEKRPGRYVGG
ncbi:crotonase/enoyl-CoA hydratase family protein [Mycobacterium sp. NAZ190054]|uniref:crotonase/enoyl-CoA hydratase family protein n=1 Tax=Mycobacterium sp. NAZ190054 TaxID=1747766 RepID=UPI00079A9982|nr:crotonase/enoyl-CoA hydratase family protein [Mycobacterium sp. NAZ190054]KWX56998.1 enoyl-CoA hydratase [Mycobacterium sp. NAZ190054]